MFNFCIVLFCFVRITKLTTMVSFGVFIQCVLCCLQSNFHFLWLLGLSVFAISFQICMNVLLYTNCKHVCSCLWWEPLRWSNHRPCSLEVTCHGILNENMYITTRRCFCGTKEDQKLTESTSSIVVNQVFIIVYICPTSFGWWSLPMFCKPILCKPPVSLACGLG